MLTSFRLALAVLAVPICLVNLAFMLMLCHRGSLKKLKNALLLSLACSDFAFGCLYIPVLLLANTIKTCLLIKCAYLLHQLVTMTAAFNLLAVVYERYIKIMHPFWFNSHEKTWLRSCIVVPALWFASLVINAIPITWMYSQNCNQSNDNITKYYDYVCMAFIILLMLLMIVAFVRIYLVVRAHLRDIRAITVPLNGAPYSDALSATVDIDLTVTCNPGPDLRSSGSGQDVNYAQTDSRSPSCDHVVGLSNRKSRRYWMVKEARIITRFATMVLLYILVWGTHYAISILQQEQELLTDVRVAKAFIIIRFLNPLVDPILVTINNRDFNNSWAVFTSWFYRLFGVCRATRRSPNNLQTEYTQEDRELVNITSVTKTQL